MNTDLKIIETSDTKIGVGISPFSGGLLVVIEDKQCKQWIDLNKYQAQALIENIKKSLTQ